MSATSVLKSVTWDPAILAASLMANLLSLAVPLAMLQIYDRVIPNAAYETLIVLALMVAFALVVDCILRISRTRLLDFFSAQFEQMAYSRAFWSVIMSDPAQGNKMDSGTLVTRLSSVERLRGQRADGAAAALLDLPFAGIFIFVLALLSPIVALTVLITLAIAFFVLTYLRKRIDEARSTRLEIEARRYSFFSEVLSGMRSVRALRIGELMSRRQEQILGTSAQQTQELARRIHQAQGFTAAIGNATPVVTAVAAGYLVLAGEASIGVLAAVVVLSGRVVQPVLRVEGYLSSLENTRQAETDLSNLTDIPLRPSGDLPLEKVASFALRNVSTAPDPEFGIAMRNLDITLETGDCLLLRCDDPVVLSVAERLLMGELTLDKGWIEVNGRAMELYDLADRQDRIRVLSENAQLLEGSLFENICAFRPEAFRNTALQLASDLGLQKVMRQNPRGLQARVQSDSNGLPQSAQRIAANICSLVTMPDVIVFQTANSGLDFETDQLLLNWLKNKAPESILILATNRPSYMALATKTLDLSHGSVHVWQDG